MVKTHKNPSINFPVILLADRQTSKETNKDETLTWFAHHEGSADLCATDVKDIAHNTLQWNLFCPTTRADIFVISIPTWL